MATVSLTPLMLLLLLSSWHGAGNAATTFIPFVQPQSCGQSSFFKSASFQCSACGNNQIGGPDGLSCVCTAGFTMKNLGSPIVQCTPCANIVSLNKRGCLTCESGNCTCAASYVQVENFQTNTVSCATCSAQTVGNPPGSACVLCQETFYEATSSCTCPATQLKGGLCFTQTSSSSVTGTVPQNSFWFSTYLDSSFLACTSYNNQTACQLLTNFVILNVNGLASKAYNLYQAASSAPYLPQLFYWSGTTGTLGQSAPKGLSFLRNAKMTFKIAKFDARGKFLGWDDVKGGTLQLCSGTQKTLDAAWLFGTSYNQSCSIQVSQLLVWFPEPVFYELFLQYNDSSGNPMVWPIPVLSQNLLQANPGTGALRRFFLVDGLTGKQNSLSDQPQYVTYASSLTLSVYLPISSPGNTPPFLLTVQYSTVNNVGQTNPQAQVAFAVTYSMDQSTMTLNTNIALGVLGSLSVFLAMLQTSSWSRRSGQQFINFMTIIKYLAFLIGDLANTFFLITFGTGIYWLISFKGQQSTVAVALPSPGGTVEVAFIIYLSLAFAFKALELLHMLVVQVTISIFLIDWEKPVNSKSSSGNQSQGLAVSAWRTFFVANEWNEIQTTRKIKPIIQLFVALLLLEVIGVKNITARDLNLAVQPGADNYLAPWSPILRYGITASIWLAAGLLQVLYIVLIYERFVEDKIRQFVDLCAMSNVSVFILMHRCYGFYIHGRSVHGHSDVSMEVMRSNLRKEAENLCALRGLEPNSEIQTFEFLLTDKVQWQIERIMQPLSELPRTRLVRNDPQGSADQNMKVYYTMNKFLSTFLEHVHKDMDYIVKDKLFLEKIMHYEFQHPIERSIFYNDPDGILFSNVLCYGNELTLLLFDLLLFCVIDLGTQNFVLAAIITFLVQQVIEILRYYLGRRNLSAKTLVDNCFLI
ncbi:meckelin-like [Erpetoichthys calabaricus]|uniref:meckelin-like n=1 Tax=Erpetoichthys calabaricus TaxID=27687 RepID=UPI0010A01B6B|nr:meckelin-like [Erpetoichthys calabaricus]